MPVVGKDGPVKHIKLSELSMEQTSIPIEGELLVLEAIEYTHHRKMALTMEDTYRLLSVVTWSSCLSVGMPQSAVSNGPEPGAAAYLEFDSIATMRGC